MSKNVYTASKNSAELEAISSGEFQTSDIDFYVFMLTHSR